MGEKSTEPLNVSKLEEKRAMPSKVNCSDESYCDDDEKVPLLDYTTGSLGVLLVILVAIFISQFGKLYQAYLELNDTRLHGRGVARIRVGNEMEREVASFVERNEPFVIRSCLSTKSFWEKDDNLLQALDPDTVLPVRVANRTNDKIPTQFRREAAPGTRGPESAYWERNMTVKDFLESYNNQKSHEHLYAAQVDVMSALPNLMPFIQEIAPPKALLDAVGKTPPRSSRPIR